MKTNKNDSKSPAENIIKKLTGYFETDRKILTDAIRSFHNQNMSYTECAQLGVKLYQLLLDNGLNESDVINPDRLLDKVEGFAYNNNINMALDILEILDAIQIWQKKDEKNGKIYCFQNEMEAEIFAKTQSKSIKWIISSRPSINLYKAKIYFENNQVNEASKIIESILEYSPSNFDALMFKLDVGKLKGNRYKEALLNNWQFAYTPSHMINFLFHLGSYYIDNKDLVTAYAIISAIHLYDTDNAESALDSLKQQMTKTVVSPYKVPSNSEIIRILKKEKINFQISYDNVEIMKNLYKKYYYDDSQEALIKELENYLLVFLGDKTELTKLKNEIKK